MGGGWSCWFLVDAEGGACQRIQQEQDFQLFTKSVVGAWGCIWMVEAADLGCKRL